jgi:general secretion pathway protein K
MAAAQKAPAADAGTAPQPMDIKQVEDLLAVPGFSVETLNKIKDFVVVLPRPTPINVNTAPAEVLAARIDTLSLADATALVASRTQAYFRDTADFEQRIPGKSPSIGANDVSVSTRYFIVNGNVRLSRASLRVRSLIERTGLVTNVIWIREN